ncbi:hypothetical protein ABIA29_006171 [Bradyrhizobium japonicum]
MTITALNTPVAIESAITGEDAPIAAPVTGPHDVGHRAGADRRHRDGIGVTECRGDEHAQDERDDSSEPKRDRTDGPGLARVNDIDLEGGRDDGEVAQHRAAHQADPGQRRQVGDALFTACGEASEEGQHETQHDRDRRAVDASEGEVFRDRSGDPHQDPDGRESGEQRVCS